jgi:hypothetical protein
VSGQLNEDAVQAFELMGIRRDAFDFNEDNLGQLVEFTVGGALRRPRAVRADKSVLYDLEWSTPFHISMLQLGLYRSFKYQGWQEPLIVVAGETFEDFCLYYCLSRLRDRVAWLMPSVTQRALGSNPDPFSRAELSFLSELQFEGTSTQNQGGVACATYSLGDAELRAVIEHLNATPLGRFRSAITKAEDTATLIRFPLVAYERDNFQRDILVPHSDDLSVSPFSTPKPKNFSRIHPQEHKYIAQLSAAEENPPKHFRLGDWTVADRRLSTLDARVGKEGPAYFCPNTMYAGGDIDTVLWRPRLYLPPLYKTVSYLAKAEGYECRPSDKGVYAEESIAKWGDLGQIATFLRDDAKRVLLDSFLDTSSSGPLKGACLRDDRRRYLDFSAIKARVGDSATGLVDELISKRILYRGFIFLCGYCRSSSWFSIAEINQEFKCRRCGRTQTYTKSHWKMPDEPAWFYKLDELVYQGYQHGMLVSLLALDYLRSSATEGFSFTTDREFWKPVSSHPEAELDFFCVLNGVLTVGEAKRENELGQSVSEENAEINKYLRIAKGLSARQVVFATLSPA